MGSFATRDQFLDDLAVDRGLGVYKSNEISFGHILDEVLLPICNGESESTRFVPDLPQELHYPRYGS